MGGLSRTLALDIGGTKIAAGIVDADGTLLCSARQPTPARLRPRAGCGPPPSVPSPRCSTVRSTVADLNGVFTETKKDYGTSIVTGFMRLNGSTVGAIANNGEDGELMGKAF